jgi:hypothetical protein
MKFKGKKFYLSTIPSFALSVLIMIGTIIAVFGFSEGLPKIIKIDKNLCGDIAYGIFELLVVAGCFFIVKWNPRSIWYAPLICNILGFIIAVTNPAFWKTSMWIVFSGGWALSLIASIVGVWVGRRAAIKKPDTPQ